MKNLIVSTLLTLQLSLGFTFSTHAEVVVPSGLNPGDKYHVIFATSSLGDATSSDVLSYDGRVKIDAETAGIGASAGIDWRAIVSTGAIDAIDHLVSLFTSVTDIPIYNTNGELVSDSFNGLWDGLLDSAIGYNENGEAVVQPLTWTGSNSDGRADLAFSYYLGSTNGGGRTGRADETQVGRWIHVGASNLTTPFSLYALSSELSVPNTPAPTTAPLFGSLGVIWLFGGLLVGLGIRQIHERS